MLAFLHYRPGLTAPRCAAGGGGGRGGGLKSARRLLSSLNGAADGAASEAIVRKYVAGSSKSASLSALSYLISVSSPFALPVYSRISKTDWFKFSPKTAASISALLQLQNCPYEAESLISESVSILKKSPKDLSLFYTNLIESLSLYGLTQKADEIYTRLQLIPLTGRKPYELGIKSLCAMGNPAEAEIKLKEMVLLGVNPSIFEFVIVAQSYGKLGSFLEMERVIDLMQELGLKIDTISFNMVLSCYGNHGEITQIPLWLQKMRELGVPPSLRTYNTALNSCPTLVRMLKEDTDSLPLSFEGLLEKLERDSLCKDEVLVIKELVKSSVLTDALTWSESGVKLDLHGFRAISAYVILLQWMDRMRLGFSGEVGSPAPSEVSVICGIGKHSVEGQSSVKVLVSRVLSRMDCPFRLDRKNVGRFIGRGKAVKEWFLRSN